MTWDDVAQSYANLGWAGEGDGSPKSPTSRVIAEIREPKPYRGGRRHEDERGLMIGTQPRRLCQTGLEVRRVLFPARKNPAFAAGNLLHAGMAFCLADC
jgi:hypothetical protein